MNMDSEKTGAKALGSIIGLALIALATFWLGGFHIVHKPTAAQLFGCSHTYINDKGEDTGECQ